MKLKPAQSILEYISIAIVFASVGMLGFILLNTLSFRGWFWIQVAKILTPGI